VKRLPSSLLAEAIRTAWTQSRDSTPSTAGAAGIDSVRATLFASRLAEHIAEIRKDIRDLTLAEFDDLDALIHLAALSNNLLRNICSRLTFELNEELLDRASR